MVNPIEARLPIHLRKLTVRRGDKDFVLSERLLEDIPTDDLLSTIKRRFHKSTQLNEVHATLYLNCQAGRTLAKLGISYDETKPVLTNLVTIMEKLVHLANANQEGSQDGRNTDQVSSEGG